METASFVMDDGVTVITRPGVRFKNPTNVALVAELQVDGPRPNPNFQRNVPPGAGNPEYLPQAFLVRREDGSLARAPIPPRGNMPKLVIPPGAEIVVPIELAEVLVTTHCRVPGCTPATCKNPTHEREVVRGLIPQLRRVTADGRLDNSPLHPALEPVAEPSHVPADADLHARVMARLGGSK